MTNPANSILVIEDEQNVRTVMAEIITYLGYNVVLAGDGRAGLNNIKSGKFDLIITDLGLPDYDGVELIEKMRRSGINTPVLMVGGVDDKTGSEKCSKWPNCHYISKPFDLNDIGRHLAALVKNSGKLENNKNNR